MHPVHAVLKVRLRQVAVWRRPLRPDRRTRSRSRHRTHRVASRRSRSEHRPPLRHGEPRRAVRRAPPHSYASRTPRTDPAPQRLRAIRQALCLDGPMQIRAGQPTRTTPDPQGHRLYRHPGRAPGALRSTSGPPTMRSGQPAPRTSVPSTRAPGRTGRSAAASGTGHRPGPFNRWRARMPAEPPSGTSPPLPRSRAEAQ